MGFGDRWPTKAARLGVACQPKASPLWHPLLVFGLRVLSLTPCPPHHHVQAPSPIKRGGRGTRGGRAAYRAVVEQEVVEEELRPARPTGRGRAHAAAEAEAAGSEDEEEDSEKQQGSLLGSILRSARKAVSGGQRGKAGEDGEHGEERGAAVGGAGWWVCVEALLLCVLVMFVRRGRGRVHQSAAEQLCAEPWLSPHTSTTADDDAVEGPSRPRAGRRSAAAGEEGTTAARRRQSTRTPAVARIEEAEEEEQEESDSRSRRSGRGRRSMAAAEEQPVASSGRTPRVAGGKKGGSRLAA